MKVPFGRYKGQDISVMAADTEYAKTQLESEAIREAFPDFIVALQDALNLESTPQTEHVPKAASTDRGEVSERKQRDIETHTLKLTPDTPKAVSTDNLRSQVRRMSPELLHMSPVKIGARAEKWEQLGMIREAKISRKWLNAKLSEES